MPPQALVIGCGYIGLPLALRLREAGYDVAVWVHSEASAAALTGHAFQRIVIGSVAAESIWKDMSIHDLVIHCASSGRGGVEAYQEVFRQGIAQMNRHQAQAKRLFVSSTSVYGQIDGEVVTEESPARSTTATAQILAAAESAAQETGTIVIRSSGIYGPGRGILFEKFRRGEAVIEGDGLRWINQIHRRDLVCAILHLIGVGQPGQIYNATDDTPVTYLDFYTWCSAFLGQPMPPFGPVNLQRKRGLTHKRVSNAKLRASGWVPHYPSFREGLTAENLDLPFES